MRSDHELRRPRDYTPLAQVEPALEFLRVLGRLLSRGPVAKKLAVLKTLALEGSGPWTIEQLQERIDWLATPSTVQVIRELRTDQVIEYQSALRRYRMTSAGRRAMLLIDLLCQPGDESQVIREIDALIARARSRGDAFEEILQLLGLAVAQLRDVRNELQELLARDTRDALLDVVQRAKQYAQQMERLAETHDDVLRQHRFDVDAKPVIDGASELVPEIARLVYDAYTRLMDDAAEVRRYGLRIDRDTVRSYVAKQSLEALADLIVEVARPAPSIPAVDLGAAIERISSRTRRLQRPTPIPRQPRALPMQELGPTPADPIETLRRQLAALEEPVDLETVIVGSNWGDAVANHARLLIALSDSSEDLPVLRTRDQLRTIDAGEVWRLTDATLEPSRRDT